MRPRLDPLQAFAEKRERVRARLGDAGAHGAEVGRFLREYTPPPRVAADTLRPERPNSASASSILLSHCSREKTANGRAYWTAKMSPWNEFVTTNAACLTSERNSSTPAS